jgi:hypothetical protein
LLRSDVYVGGDARQQKVGETADAMQCKTASALSVETSRLWLWLFGGSKIVIEGFREFGV